MYSFPFLLRLLLSEDLFICESNKYWTFLGDELLFLLVLTVQADSDDDEGL